MTRADPANLIAPVVARSRLIAVVTLDDWRDGPPLARALARGGAPTVEITLRTTAGLEAIRAAAAEAPEAAVGAGTVLTRRDLDSAQAAGAAFAVSPGATPELFEAAADMAMPYLAGVATPSEVMIGLERGYTTFKFFPAVPAGGLDYLKALAGPFPHVRFCPTGGVTAETAAAFLALPNVPCLGGSWITPTSALREKNWEEIERLALAASTSLAR